MHQCTQTCLQNDFLWSMTTNKNITFYVNWNKTIWRGKMANACLSDLKRKMSWIERNVSFWMKYWNLVNVGVSNLAFHTLSYPSVIFNRENSVTFDMQKNRDNFCCKETKSRQFDIKTLDLNYQFVCIDLNILSIEFTVRFFYSKRRPGQIILPFQDDGDPYVQCDNKCTQHEQQWNRATAWIIVCVCHQM